MAGTRVCKGGHTMMSSINYLCKSIHALLMVRSANLECRWMHINTNNNHSTFFYGVFVYLYVPEYL